jgi:hypothetical protein
LIDSHLALVRDGISFNWSSCRDVPKFEEIAEFLAHAVNVHEYDVHIKLQHLPKRPTPSSSDTSSVGSAEALESDNMSRTDTPLSSLDSEAANIDPRLLDSQDAAVTRPPPRRSKRLRLK